MLPPSLSSVGTVCGVFLQRVVRVGLGQELTTPKFFLPSALFSPWLEDDEMAMRHAEVLPPPETTITDPGQMCQTRKMQGIKWAERGNVLR